MTRAVRGAIQIEQATVRLINEIRDANAIAENFIVSIIFSLTTDLTAFNPATALRRHGYAETPLFCTQEARVDGGMPRMIRVLLTYESLEHRRIVPIYLDGAESLRPDLTGGHGS